MSEFTVNGIKKQTDEVKSLMDFLRDDLNLTSVKDGCAEGACGACTIIIDGEAKKACVFKTDKMDGKNVITTEGLTEKEQEVYAYSFARAGAVQCGFCTPGMVMSAKALIDKNPAPTREQVKDALKNNICRCTGYKKIADAIMLAADIFSGKSDMHIYDGAQIGHNLPRVDAPDKTLGKAEYTDDIRIDGMLYGGAVRSRFPRGKVISINLDKAKTHPDYVAAATYDDVPGAKQIGHIQQDWPVLTGEGQITHMLGDALVLIAAKTKKGLKEIIDLVEIEQEELTPVTSPAEAMAEGAPDLHPKGNVLFHQHLHRGDPDAKLATSKYVVTEKFSTPFTEHAFLEPECAVALPDGDGIRIYSADQGVFQTRKECAAMLGMDVEKVRVIAKTVGGGFGGKEDMSVQHHAALLAWLTQKPVRFKLSRKESIMIHPKRHPMEMEFTVGCDEDGRLTAMKATIISDTGAYASLGGPVLQRACTHAAGPYNYQDVDIDGKAIYTNNPPAGAFRGFGVTQSCFAMESCLNRLAEKCGLTPFEIRYINAIRPGQVLPNGQIAGPDTALAETMDALKDIYTNAKYAGIACAMKNSGLGVGLRDVGRCRIVIKDGKAHIRTSAAAIGQGLMTVLVQIACTETGLPPESVVHDTPDTKYTPDSGMTTASRQTVFTGEATRRAATLLKADLDTGLNLEDLEGKEYYGEFETLTHPIGADVENPISHVAYGYATQVITLDDEGKVDRMIAAHDVGQAINPLCLEGQIEGGMVMSLGYALTEQFPLKQSVPMAKFGTLGLLKSNQTPDVEVVIVGKGEPGYAFGAKGVGEICSIPTAPALAEAYKMFDGNIRNSLPLENTPYQKKKKA